MLFIKESVRLVDKRTYAKNDNTYYFLKIADTSTFENLEMLINRDCNFDELVIGKDYRAEVSIDGRYSNLRLLPIK